MRKTLCLLLMLIALDGAAQERVRSEGQSLLFLPDRNRTAAEAGLRLRSEDEALLPAEGKGLLQGEFRARSRHSLDSARRVEGSVSYERGVRRAVCWNTTSDWRLLSPYVTVDTVGGDLQKEQYRFHARYAAHAGRFFWGAAADYRALQEYRNVDPRPRNVTADLQVQVQGGLRTGGSALSLEAGYRRYNQQNDIVFRDPLGNNTAIIHDFGFGRYSERFSGAKGSVAVRFKGHGFSALARLEPQDGRGWIASSEYTFLRVDRHLPDQNETPVSRLVRQEIRLSGGRKGTDRFLEADVRLRLKNGSEFIVDHTSAFGTIGALPLYRDAVLEASLTGYREWVRSGVTWSLEPRAGYAGVRAGNAWPGAELAFRHGTVSLAGGAAFRGGTWEGDLRGLLGGAFAFGNTLDLPAPAWGGERQAAEWEHLYGRLTDHAVRAALQGRAARSAGKGLRLYLRPEISLTYYLKNHWSISAYGALGIEF